MNIISDRQIDVKTAKKLFSFCFPALFVQLDLYSSSCVYLTYRCTRIDFSLKIYLQVKFLQYIVFLCCFNSCNYFNIHCKRNSKKNVKCSVFICNLVETSERTPTEKELASVSKHIGTDFYVLGLHLGLTSATIEQIRMAYSHSVQTQILKILLSWKNKDGSQATIGKLLHAVKTHSNNVDIFEIERIFECDKK